MTDTNSIQLSEKPKFTTISFVLISSLIVTIILIPPVFLMEHDVKYPLYFFSILLTGLVILFIFKKNFEYKISFPSLKIVDYFFLNCSLLLLAFNVFSDTSGEFPFILSLIVPFFLTGWVFTRLFNFEKSRLNLNLLVLVFCLSIGLTALLYFATLITGTLSILPAVFAGIAFIPIIKDRLIKNKNDDDKKHHDRQHSVFDLLLILIVIGFFIFFLTNIYPEINDVRGRDAVTHFLFTNQQVITPDLYGSIYPWFHHTWGAVLQMASPSMSMFLTGISVLSIFLIFSFYIMSKEYLKKIDRRAHLLATIFFSFFTGLGWFYFIQNKLSAGLYENPFAFEWSLLQTTRHITWWDVGVGQSMWLYSSFRPLAVAFILIFVILYLMKRDDLSKRNFVIIVSFLGLTLSQIHVPEFIFFIVFLLAVAAFLPKVKLRLKLTCISLFFSSIAFLLMGYVYGNYFGADGPHTSLENYFLLLPVITFSAFVLSIFNKRPKISFRLNSKIINSIIIFVFFILVIIWFSNVDDFEPTQLKTIFAVPIEFYPVLLGITGLFGMLGGIIVLKKHSDHPITIFIIFMIVGFVFARLLSYLNANIIETSYFERRIIPMVFVSVSMLAPLLVLKLVGTKNILTSLKTKDLGKIAFLASIIFVGTFSTFLTFEYQIFLTERSSITSEERDMILALQDADPYSSLITVTSRSMNDAEFLLIGQILDSERFKLWDWASPEMPLNAITSLDSPSVFFLRDDDKKIISEEFSDGYIGSHLVKISSYLSDGKKQIVTYLPKMSPPVSVSTTVLALPEKQDSLYYAYDFLSFGNYHYTTALIHDIETIRNAETLIAPNEKIGNQLIELRQEYNLKFNKMIIFNLNGEDSASSSYMQNMIDNNSKVLANYENSEPLIIQDKFSDFEIFYANVLPIIDNLEKGENSSNEFSDLYNTILQIVDENLQSYVATNPNQFRFQPGGYFTFDEFHATGEVSIFSSSIISQIDSHLSVNIDGKNEKFEDVFLILPVSVDKSQSKTIEALIKNGTGFYSTVLMNSSTNSFEGNPAIVSLVGKNGDIKKIEGQKIQIDLPESITLIRQPTIQVDGILEFEDIVAQGPLEKKLRTTGGKFNRFDDLRFQNLILDGLGNFTIKYSDDYLFANQATLKGEKSYSEPVYPHDELRNLLGFFSVSSRSQ